ncbi:MAG: hypothetical protein QW096_11970 [Thermofilaceae archaeon]
MIWMGILAGMAAGALTAILGYAKSVATETFDPSKAIQTLIIGAIIGGYAGYAGVTYEQAYEFFGTVGAITLIEYLKKAIWRAITRRSK